MCGWMLLGGRTMMSWILCREFLASIAKCWFGYGATIGMAYESHNWIC